MSLRHSLSSGFCSLRESPSAIALLIRCCPTQSRTLVMRLLKYVGVSAAFWSRTAEIASANSSLSVAAVKRQFWSFSESGAPSSDCAIWAANTTSAGSAKSGSGVVLVWVDSVWIVSSSVMSLPPHAAVMRSSIAKTGARNFEILNAICSPINVSRFLNPRHRFLFSFAKRPAHNT